nr:reverse transcriptase [Tanacetum cinerariifolium]
MTAMLKQFQATPPPAPVKAVEEICVTCGGAHPHYQCLATGGNTFPELRDNIQGCVSATAVNYNQGNPGYRPSCMANQIRPPGFAQPNVQTNQNRFGLPFRFNHGNEQSYQASASQNQNVHLNELEKVRRMKEDNMKAMQTQIDMVKNELRNEMKSSIQTSLPIPNVACEGLPLRSWGVSVEWWSGRRVGERRVYKDGGKIDKYQYDYEIVYKKGSENVVADALSRMDSSGELLQIYVSSVSSGVWDKVKDKEGEVVVGNDPELRKELVQHFHDEAIGGHSGAHVTMKNLGSLFYCKGLKKMVKQMIRDCNVCQRQKLDLSAYPGLIQPLSIPERIWKEISMNFIKKLPTSHGKSVILVVVDRLRKYAHFIPLTHPFTASQVAQVLLDQVYKMHGLPESIVSDRDKTEVVNKSLGCYLRCMCGEKPKEWVKWLPLAEFWYNANYHTSTKTTPYEAVSCQTPPIYVSYILEDNRVEEVDRTLQAREEAIKVLKFHLKRSQDRMRNQANKHKTDRQFEVGDWVYLKLQPHRKVSIRQGRQHKISPKYYGPFKVSERIREVAYRLEFLSSSQIHPVFHM